MTQTNGDIGRDLAGAAETMAIAASCIDTAMQQHTSKMDAWMKRFERAIGSAEPLRHSIEAVPVALPPRVTIAPPEASGADVTLPAAKVGEIVSALEAALAAGNYGRAQKARLKALFTELGRLAA